MTETFEAREQSSIKDIIEKHFSTKRFDFNFEIDDPKNPVGLHIRCIDGRESRQPLTKDKQPLIEDDSLPEIARPGGGLGYILVVLGAMKILKLEGNTRGIQAVSEALGSQVTFHTDSHHQEDIPCAGCGHIMAALNNPEKYGLDKKIVKDIKKYIPKLTDQLEKNNKRPVVYDGDHQETSAVIIDVENVGLPNLTESGQRLYVYNRANDREILDKIAVELHKNFPKADLSAIQDAIVEASKLQTNLTLEKLAGNLPKFSISKNAEGQLIVTSL